MGSLCSASAFCITTYNLRELTVRIKHRLMPLPTSARLSIRLGNLKVVYVLPLYVSWVKAQLILWPASRASLTDERQSLLAKISAVGARQGTLSHATCIYEGFVNYRM